MLLRNRSYGGTRPQHVARFDVDLQAASPADILDRGAKPRRLGMGTQRRLRREPLPETGRPVRGWPVAILDRNRSRIQRLYTEYLATAVPERAPRRAASFAVNRAAVRKARGTPWNGSRLTDRYLPRLPGVPARGDLPAQTRERWEGQSSGGEFPRKPEGRALHAPLPSGRRRRAGGCAQLQKIGLDVEVKRILPGVFVERLSDPDEPWDLVSLGWSPRLPRSAAYLNTLFEGGSWPFHFDSRRFNRGLQGAARLRGRTDIARTDDSTSTSPATPRRWSRSTT